MTTQSPHQTDTDALPLSSPAPSGSRVNPWLFVPVLYVMQGMPVTTVQEMFTVAWKDLHVANPLIAAWTAIISLPWTLKLFWSPLVDLNSTKRRWTIVMQLLLTLAFVALAWGVTRPQYGAAGPLHGFYLTLALLLLMGCLSSTHDIACDGLYILSLTKPQQAAWVGVQGTAYKLGRWLCVGALVFLAGKLEQHNVAISSAWAYVIGAAAVIYGAGAVYNLFFLPRPPSDTPAVQESPGEAKRDILRTLTVVAIGVCLYFLVAASIRILGDWIFDLVNADRLAPLRAAAAAGDAGAIDTLTRLPAATFTLDQWSQGPLPRAITFLGLPFGSHPAVFQQYLTFAAALLVIVPLIVTARGQLRGTAMAESFSSFVRQRGFWSILAFVMFYRFGEAMVTRTLPLFLKDPPTRGGLGISTADVGVIVGTFGVFGIIFGGVLGGLIVSRLGLRRAFWPLAIAMHAPNVLYLVIAYAYHPSAAPHAWQNLPFTNWPLSVAAFVHEFGYGFGFAAYFVFLMDVAQRDNFKTAHYAFGTGLGALCIVVAGIVSAILLASFHGPTTYTLFFLAVCVLTVPGLLTLLIIPLGPNHGSGATVPARGGH